MKKSKFIALILIIFLSTNYLSIYPQTLKGTVLQKSFTGTVTGKTVYYNIYLPENYGLSGAKYPVVYMLHGYSQDRGGTQNTIVPQMFESANDKGILGKFIIVFPDGYNDSFWGDSKDGSKPAETNFIKELIPYIDANYNTIADRKSRVIQGFSMGGFGAAKCISKYPELFSTAILYDAAILKWNEMKLVFPSVASGVYGNDENYFNQYSPWYWTPVNAAKMKDSVRVRFVVGQYPVLNTPYRDLLGTYSISKEYVETGCAHDLNCLISKEGENNAKFIAQSIPPTYSVSGKFAYANSNNTPLSLIYMLAKIINTKLYIGYTDYSGNYSVDGLEKGMYAFLAPENHYKWGGVNSTDALAIRRYLASLVTLDPMQLLAADINGDGKVTSTDALLLRRRIAGIDTSFAAGDWIYNNFDFEIKNLNMVKDIKVICRGDVNASYIPQTAAKPKEDEKP